MTQHVFDGAWTPVFHKLFTKSREICWRAAHFEVWCWTTVSLDPVQGFSQKPMMQGVLGGFVLQVVGCLVGNSGASWARGKHQV